ncbi:MAG: hypothetical protein QNJ84_15725 [Alphaproteobacteria bacterium]|nr:hypothetical protein [Alphaproteobacteria bacterium]
MMIDAMESDRNSLAESFVSRLFGRDLDTGSWFVEFIEIGGDAARDEEVLRAGFDDEPHDSYGMDEDGVVDETAGFARFWGAKRRG